MTPKDLEKLLEPARDRFEYSNKVHIILLLAPLLCKLWDAAIDLQDDGEVWIPNLLSKPLDELEGFQVRCERLP